MGSSVNIINAQNSKKVFMEDRKKKAQNHPEVKEKHVGRPKIFLLAPSKQSEFYSLRKGDLRKRHAPAATNDSVFQGGR